MSLKEDDYMVLKVKNTAELPGDTPAPDYDSLIEAERAKVLRLEAEFNRVHKEMQDSRNRLAVLTLERDTGFKVGDTVSFPVPSGRTKKMTTCIIECESGQVFVRPIKKDGSFSTRHFYLYTGDYKDLKAVK